MKSKFEVVIVFKKNISEEDAEKLMSSFGFAYRKGMDSSRGKIYFYSTGPKFIISFEDEDQMYSFRGKHHQFLPEIHEIYEADWDKCKD